MWGNFDWATLADGRVSVEYSAMGHSLARGQRTTSLWERPKFELATPARRFSANAIDSGLWGIPFMVIVAVLLITSARSAETSWITHDRHGRGTLTEEAKLEIADTTTKASLMLAGITATYFITFTWLGGQTLGKLKCGTRVVSLASGKPVRLPQAVVRYGILAAPQFAALALRFSGGPLELRLLAAGAGFIVVLPILFNPLKMGLHDRVAGTVVVRTWNEWE